MHGSFNRLRESRNRADRDWTVAVFALPILALIVLVALTIIQPAAPGWISQAAQAEFGIVNSPEIVPTQPAMQIRTVKAY
jgi:hypothetical protein